LSLSQKLILQAFTFAPGRHFPAQPKNRAFAEKVIEIIPSLVTEHGLRGPPLDVRQGLDGIKQGIEELLVSVAMHYQSYCGLTRIGRGGLRKENCLPDRGLINSCLASSIYNKRAAQKKFVRVS
jgi:hypothetical protein